MTGDSIQTSKMDYFSKLSLPNLKTRSNEVFPFVCRTDVTHNI